MVIKTTVDQTAALTQILQKIYAGRRVFSAEFWDTAAPIVDDGFPLALIVQTAANG